MELLELKLPENIDNLQLPDPGLLNFYKNAENRTFLIDYEIDDSLLAITQYIMQANHEDDAAGIAPDQRKPIKIILYTGGGSLEAALHFIDVCALSKTPIITVNAGRAMSAGLVMLLAGHKRYGLPHSRALIHQGSGGVIGTYDECESGMGDYKEMVKMMKNYILSRTSISKSVFGKRQSKDWYLYIDDQLKYGIVDGVLDDLDQIA